ncbi:jg13309 [Pararge aegeria aegeria]|uniref:Jg13309 protein n=1 Tax=Pararge aegeria aegeria TaxID=348720 RepID=A0A8S4REV0_9NEOP|nr:jg13309 [Pararge aegeria aegeria]
MLCNSLSCVGQWRTLRKDAIPSQNLPADSPVPHMGRSSSWTSPPAVIDARMHQQMAQAIYVQTMLAMQAAGITALGPEPLSSPTQPTGEAESSQSPPLLNTYTLEQILAHKTHQDIINTTQTSNHEVLLSQIQNEKHRDTMTFKCTQCSKCFKDPDVFILHKRIHAKEEAGNTDEMLRANPILANLLKSDTSQAVTDKQNNLDSKNVKSIESQIMTALAANMENYLRNLTTIMTHGNTMEPLDNQFENGTSDSQDDNSSNCDSKDLNESSDSNLVIDEDAS